MFSDILAILQAAGMHSALKNDTGDEFFISKNVYVCFLKDNSINFYHKNFQQKLFESIFDRLFVASNDF